MNSYKYRTISNRFSRSTERTLDRSLSARHSRMTAFWICVVMRVMGKDRSSFWSNTLPQLSTCNPSPLVTLLPITFRRSCPISKVSVRQTTAELVRSVRTTIANRPRANIISQTDYSLATKNPPLTRTFSTRKDPGTPSVPNPQTNRVLISTHLLLWTPGA